MTMPLRVHPSFLSVRGLGVVAFYRYRLGRILDLADGFDGVGALEIGVRQQCIL
ncbi:MAG: hypothetical protein ACE5LU_26760 [Anaerolineae bacterium]